MEIRFEQAAQLKAKPAADAKLGFGKLFTDYMFVMDYDREIGWHDARIVPFAPIPMHPACTVLHYGSEIFEGLKAYRREDGEVQLFRPMENVRRMNMSAERLCLPQLDEEFALEALKKFVSVEKDWVPSAPGTSLYLRPFMMGMDEYLGVHAASKAMFVIIASPSGSYYAAGINPVGIMIETEDVRAVRGGTGYAKCGGNYAASIRAGERAEKKGFSQVLWLDGVERKYIEEVGAMNIMFKIAGKVITPALLGSVLPGITRKSCIELLKNWGYEVEERKISIDELIEAMQNGTLEEAWGTGTAAVVSPVGKLAYEGGEYIVNNNQIGSLTQRLYDELTGIQWGKKEDVFGWVESVE